MPRGLAVAALALAVAVAGAVELLADARISAAAVRPQSAAAIEAGSRAVALVPWRADTRVTYAQALWQAGRTAEARRQFEAALRSAPADAAPWLQYEYLLVAIAPDDPMLSTAAERVASLAPNEPLLQLAQADLAAQNWHRAAQQVRPIWLSDLRYALAHDHDPFLLRTFRAGADTNLCTESRVLGIEEWCGFAVRIRLNCAGGELTAAQALWCKSVNVPPPSGYEAVQGRAP